MANNEKTEWDAYITEERTHIEPLLAELGYTLEEDQPHLSGERYLMQAVTTTSGRKLILIGVDTDGTRVVIKATRDPRGMEELLHERSCRQTLETIDFAYDVFHTPKELVWVKRNGYLIVIHAFIEQDSTFISRPITEQFSLALSAFKAQESARATTYAHIRRVRNTFGSMDATGYLNTFEGFIRNINTQESSSELASLLDQAKNLLTENKDRIQQYGGFLTHTDFVPHNFRVVGSDIYLLDTASLRFGNKYEGWARFINFMMLYNPPLVEAFVQYVRDNRSPEESEALRLMRIYRLGEILCYYSGWVERVDENLLELTHARITFWTEALNAVLKNESLSSVALDTYRSRRDELRSEDEKRRQENLH
ncbi:MAG: hypothetical protein AB203_04410 [Parcubacteria bacterium C7867-008]|nr:MAG: hypothetical protein AB203_04410 [Parcubacteria bacterium C7867-008]